MTVAVERLLTEHLDTWTAAVETKSAAGRGSSKKLNLVGIKKLRELILELAVRGQLVPQDENDEPAEVLLARIAAERERLVKEKKIKKPKKLPDISEDEFHGLPSTWRWVYLSDLVLGMDAGWSPACKPEPSPSEEIWGVLKTTAVQTMDYHHRENKTLPLEKEPKPQYEVKSGDILITRAGPKNRVGISCLVHETRPKLMISDKIIRFHLIQAGLYERYISLCLNAGLTSRHIEESKSGMAESQMNISQDKLKAAPIPLCPVPEQKHIVAKVDELMALCDALEQEQESSIAAHGLLVENLLAALTNAANQGEFKQAWARVAAHFDTLFTTEQSVEQLKQTILQLAVMGKLVEQDPADEPAGVLLERIAAEKARLVKEKKIKKQKVLPEISEEEKVFELPEGWAWCRLQSMVLLLGDGLHGTPEYSEDGEYYFVNGNNLKNGEVVIKPETKKVSESQYLKYKKDLGQSTVLVSINGTLGSVAFYNDEKIMLGKSACYFNLAEGISKSFIKILMESPMFQEYAFRSATGSTIKNLGLKAMNTLPVCLPTFSEQIRIVDKVEQLMTICSLLGQKIAMSKSTQMLLANTLTDKSLTNS